MAEDIYRSYRGAILEEVVLYILSKNGYVPIFSDANDDSLKQHGGSLKVKGRGAQHQIDAIADARYSPPFCHKQRLLVEAKFLRPKVRIDVIRNAAGVLKDVCEFWVPEPRPATFKRYHYMYGVFSRSDFTLPAQQYAFAHDIYLLPIKKNIFFHPIIDALERFGVKEDPNLNDEDEHVPQIKHVRGYLRSRLFQGSLSS